MTVILLQIRYKKIKWTVIGINLGQQRVGMEQITRRRRSFVYEDFRGFSPP